MAAGSSLGGPGARGRSCRVLMSTRKRGNTTHPPDRWAEIQELFEQALDLAPEARSAMLAARCRDDDLLRDEIESLLVMDAALDDFDEVPATIGDYRVVRQLGAGGMGVVYLAERERDGSVAQVAIKLLPYAFGSMVPRFREERRILASLRHPNIAAFLDAGRMPDGRYYLVMEWVDGEPIDIFIERTNLPLRARLGLFCEVCAGVQFAHQRMVIHRDIKPSNILVDRNGVCKLLDFGVAKMSGNEEGPALTTPTSPVGMTLQYASPEQIRGEDVTAVSDVYGLGALLFELLTGQAPPTATERAGLPNRELLPSRSGDAPALRGDVDTIVMTALAACPHERYASAKELAEDISRYCSGHPIQARKQSNWYVFRRFVARNKWGSVGAATSGLFILSLGLGLAVQSTRVVRERDEADLARNFLSEVLVSSAMKFSPEQARGLEVVVDERVLIARDRFRDDPRVASELLQTFAEVYVHMRADDKSLQLLREAMELHSLQDELDSASVGHTAFLIGKAHLKAGRLEASATITKLALEAFEESLGPHDLMTAHALTNIGVVRHIQGRYEQAHEYHHRAHEIRTGTLFVSDSDLAQSLYNLGIATVRVGRHEVGLSMLHRSLELRQRDKVTTAPRIAEMALARTYAELARPAQARSLMNSALNGIEFERSDLARVLTHLSDAYVHVWASEWGAADRALVATRDAWDVQGGRFPWFEAEITQVEAWVLFGTHDRVRAVERWKEARRLAESYGVALPKDPPSITPIGAHPPQ